MSTTFNYNGGTYGTDGSIQTYTVPAGVTTIFVDAYGASGNNYNHGKGGRVQVYLPVTPGEVLNIYVGGSPNNTNWGGFNGGGRSESVDDFPENKSEFFYGGGGGATDIRRGGTELLNRIIVAGGGGGGGGGGAGGGRGGRGGGLTGANGTDHMGDSQSGLGGSQTKGGDGGSTFGAVPSHIASHVASNVGQLGEGGDGFAISPDVFSGGGGGGYYGGGGGYLPDGGGGFNGGGGGGGSSYTHPGSFNTIHSERLQEGHGKLIISLGINLDGNPDISHQLGEAFVDPGAVTSDGSSYTVNSTVDVNVAGRYTITYTKDNDQTSVYRTVEVVEDLPFFFRMWNGDKTTVINTLNGLHPGWTVEENKMAAEITGKTVRNTEFSGTVVKKSELLSLLNNNSTAVITFTTAHNLPTILMKDPSFTSSTSLLTDTYTTNENSDWDSDWDWYVLKRWGGIKLDGNPSISHQLGEAFVDPGAATSDGSSYTVSGDTVDVNVAGTYTITYTKDNDQTSVSRTVVVKDLPFSFKTGDKTTLINTLNGLNDNWIVEGSKIAELITDKSVANTDFGWWSSDPSKRVPTKFELLSLLKNPEIAVIAFNTAHDQPQIYMKDPSFTSSTSLLTDTYTTKVHIDWNVLKRVPTPVISGSPTSVIVGKGYLNTDYRTLGVTANDDNDGDITANIVVTGTVNTSTIGTYLLTYNVSNASGIQATPFVRTVQVVLSKGYRVGVGIINLKWGLGWQTPLILLDVDFISYINNVATLTMDHSESNIVTRDVFVGLDCTDQAGNGPNFTGCNVAGMNFSGSNLSGGNFTNATLSNANFSNCNLTGATFFETNIDGCDFRGATLDNLVADNLYALETVKITGAKFDDTYQNRSLFTASQQADVSFILTDAIVRQEKMEATLVISNGRALKTQWATVNARTALKEEIASVTDLVQKKLKRRAGLKSMFDNNVTLKQIPMTREELGISSQKLKRANVAVFKANETIDITAVNNSNESFYCSLENGEQVTLSKDDKSFTVKRQDTVDGERYAILNSTESPVKSISKDGGVYTAGSYDLKEDDVFSVTFTTQTHDFFIGSVGDGSGATSGDGGGSGGASGDPFLVTLL